MPIEQKFDSKDDAPEFLRPSLVEEGGKFIFRAELPTETAGIKAALQKERERADGAERNLKGFEGLDPAKARKVIEDAEKAERDRLKNQGDWDAREKQLQDQYAKDLDGRTKQFQAQIDTAKAREAKLQRSLEENLIAAQATAAIVAKGGKPKVLLPHVVQQIKVMEEGDSFVARVIDASGNPRISSVKGDPFTIDHLVEELRNDTEFGGAFDASRAGGSGAPGSSNPGGTSKTIRRAEYEAMGAQARSDFFKAGGVVKD